MRITVFDETLTKKTTIYTFLSLLWQPRYNEVGNFLLSLQLNDQNFNIIKIGYFLEFDEDTSKTAMLVESISVENGVVSFGGKSALSLFSRRVNSTLYTNIKFAEDIMYMEYVMMERFSILQKETKKSFVEVFNSELKTGTALERILKVAQTTGLGVKVSRKNEYLYFEVYKGVENKYATVAQKFLNVGNEKLAKTISNFANVLYVVGEKNNGSTYVVKVGETGLEDIELFETVVHSGYIQKDDESDEVFDARLTQKGLDELSTKQIIELLDFETQVDASLGDIILVDFDKFSFQTKTIISGVDYVVENNMLKRNFVLGNLSITKRSDV